MAKYSTEIKVENKEKRAAVLEMDGWRSPAEWEGKYQRPNCWPDAAVSGLIKLFTGEIPEGKGPDGVQIPDVLGWHIAALMEDWVTFAYSSGGPPEKMMPKHSQDWYANGLSLHRTWMFENTEDDIS